MTIDHNLYIQLACMGNYSVSIQVYREPALPCGRVLIYLGELWSASRIENGKERVLCQEKLRKLLFDQSFKKVECVPLDLHGPRTIDGNWQQILLDAARLNDELALIDFETVSDDDSFTGFLPQELVPDGLMALDSISQEFDFSSCAEFQPVQQEEPLQTYRTDSYASVASLSPSSLLAIGCSGDTRTLFSQETTQWLERCMATIRSVDGVGYANILSCRETLSLDAMLPEPDHASPETEAYVSQGISLLHEMRTILTNDTQQKMTLEFRLGRLFLRSLGGGLHLAVITTPEEQLGMFYWSLENWVEELQRGLSSNAM